MASRKEIFSYLDIAAQIALRGQNRRDFFLGAVGIRRDGAIVYAFNSPTPEPNYRIHSEFRLAKKLDVGSIVYVARVLKDPAHQFAMSRPCPWCEKALRTRGVKRVYYSIGPGEYGVMDF